MIHDICMVVLTASVFIACVSLAVFVAKVNP